MILIACEESQAICIAFRNLGFEAFSADIQECSGGRPEWHIKGDVLPFLNGRCSFITQDGLEHYNPTRWDLIIAHPPCTYLAFSGNRWFNVERYGSKALERIKLREEAYQFFLNFVNCDCDFVAIENPLGYISRFFGSPSQIIQPYFFGDPVKKSTCLWLRGLPLLKPTHIVEPITGIDTFDTFLLPAEERRKIRSKTFPGIASAIATQWGEFLRLQKFPLILDIVS